MSELWPWLALVLLGAYHGINPGMGWLFAVALGLQEKRRAAVLRSLGPITLGHALSVAAVVLAVALLEEHLPHRVLRYGGAAVLVAFGLYRLVRAGHPRWGGMQVGWRDLTIWSFLMASAHGAGLMLVPVLLGWPSQAAMEHSAMSGAGPAVVSEHSPDSDSAESSEPTGAAHRSSHVHNAGAGGDGMGSHAGHGGALQEASRGHVGLALLAVVVHTLAYLVVTAAVAVLVYEKLGLALLRRAWWNLDLLWAVVLMATGVLTLLV